MNEQICIQHEGGEVRYSTSDNRWVAFVDGQQVASRQSLLEAQAAITALRKKEAKGEFKRRAALLYSGYGGGDGGGCFIECEVTSHADMEHTASYRGNSPEAWVNVHKSDASVSHSFSAGRSKVSFDRLRVANERNRALIEEMNDLSGQIRSLEQARKKLYESMDKYTGKS